MTEEKQPAEASASAGGGKKELNLEELKKKLEDCQKLKDEYLAGWQRARADFLNYKKEEMERIGEILKYEDLGLILKILPILDNFEISEKKLPENLKSDENIRGLLLIKKQILDFLKSQEIEEIKSVGEKFDPNFHEIIGEVSPSEASLSPEALAKEEAKEDEKLESRIVIEEIQKGYTIQGRLLRPAKVKVAK